MFSRPASFRPIALGTLRTLVAWIQCVVIALSCWVANGAESPRRGGTMRLRLLTDWRSMDPAYEFEVESGIVMRLVFRGLLDYDPSGTLVTDQAQDWNVSPDGKTYVFHLKPGVRFAHGREVEAEDYVYTLERTLDPKVASLGQTYYLDILGAKEFIEGRSTRVAGLNAPDNRTLVIQLKEPSYTFPAALTLQFASVLPREIARKYGRDFMYHLVGSGPYQVAEWERGVRWRLDRNPHYNGPETWIDAFEIQVGGDRALASMLIQRGELDRVQTDSVQAITFRKDPTHRSWLHTVPMVAVSYLFMNTELKPFDDVRVRRAVNHAVDRQRIVKLLGGLQDVATGIVPPSMPWSNPGLLEYPFDPDKARDLLRQAGFPSGFKSEILFRLDGLGHERMAQSIQNDLKAVGIEVELKPLSMAAFFDKVQSRRQAQMGINSWSQDYPDPSNFLDILLNGNRITETECQNCAFFSHPEFNQLIAQAGQSMDSTRRTSLFRQAEKLAMEQAPWVPLIFQRTAILRHPRVHGDVGDPVWLWRFERMWLDP